MTVWDGRGLPPAAQTRVERAARSGVKSSLLSSPSMASLEHVGMAAVGEAMGCVVQHLGWGGYGCGVTAWSGTGYLYTPPLISGHGNVGYAPYVRSLYHGYEEALHRLLVEAQMLGADGVVGVRWSQKLVDEIGNREFLALGTAVRCRSTARPAHIFATHLRGEDVAKLLLSGWVASGMAVGISVGVKHDDYYTQSQANWVRAGNVEVAGYTDLVHGVRVDAREQFAKRAAVQGGDSAIVDRMSLNVMEVGPSDQHRDHVAQAVLIGTALASFDTTGGRRTPALAMLPLDRKADRRST